MALEKILSNYRGGLLDIQVKLQACARQPMAKVSRVPGGNDRLGIDLGDNQSQIAQDDMENNLLFGNLESGANDSFYMLLSSGKGLARGLPPKSGLQQHEAIRNSLLGHCSKFPQTIWKRSSLHGVTVAGVHFRFRDLLFLPGLIQEIPIFPRP